MKIVTNKKEINKLFERIEKTYPSEQELKKILMSGKRLVVYHGIDPTASFLHLGHSYSLFLLKRFRDLGHKTIVLIGDFTAQIGDPSGKDKARKPLTKEEVLENYKSYKEHIVKKIFKNEKGLTFKFNSKWWEKMLLKDFFELLSLSSVQRMLERDMFQRRQKAGRPIWLHEFVYPLLQGYDSVAMDVDIEIGGSDQTFNMLAGRDLVKNLKKKEKFVVTVPLMEQTTGKKMSKSEGEVISLNDSPVEMYGKVMAFMPDKGTMECFRIGTDATDEEIEKAKKSSNPRDQKAKLAKKLVAIYHNKTEAEKAEKEFERVFKEKKIPAKIPKVSIKEKQLNILNLLAKAKLVSSKSEAKRLIFQKGVKIDGQVQKDWRKSIKIKKGMIIQVGKRRFAKII